MNREDKISQLKTLLLFWPVNRQQADTAAISIEGLSFITDAFTKDISQCLYKGEYFYKIDLFPAHAVLQPSAGDQWRNCPSSVVVENDFRLPEFRDANPEDYERDEHGKIVRKDRFKTSFDTLFDILGLEGGTRNVETVISHFSDLTTTEDMFSQIVNLVGVSESRLVVGEVRKLVNLQRALRNNARMDAEEMAEHIELTEASLVQDWTIADFINIGWDMGLMVVHGFARFKKIGVAPTPMPNTPQFKNAPYATLPNFPTPKHPTTKA